MNSEGIYFLEIFRFHVLCEMLQRMNHNRLIISFGLVLEYESDFLDQYEHYIKLGDQSMVQHGIIQTGLSRLKSRTKSGLNFLYIGPPAQPYRWAVRAQKRSVVFDYFNFSELCTLCGCNIILYIQVKIRPNPTTVSTLQASMTCLKKFDSFRAETIKSGTRCTLIGTVRPNSQHQFRWFIRF